MRRWQPFVGIVICFLQAGCGTEQSAAPTPQGGAPAPPTATTGTAQPEAMAKKTVIEISNPEVRLERGTDVHYSLKYRFVEGAPQPDMWYAVELSFEGAVGAGVKEFQGKDLQVEGTIADGLRLFKPGAVRYRMHISEARGKGGPYNAVSNVLEGPLS
jgi:hypothetical protein